jgi:hypothetical protein
MKGAATAVVAVMMALSVVGSERRLQSIDRADPLGRKLLFLPTAESLRFVSLGNEGLVADVMFVWAIQYYSQYEPSERFLYLDNVFDVITDLDPKFYDAYRIGGLIMQIQTSGDQEAAKQGVIRLFNKGLHNLPQSWQLAEAAAWDMEIRYRDLEDAIHFMERAAAVPDAPSRIARILGRWKDEDHAWTLHDSVEYWRDTVENATDDYARDAARRHLYDVMVQYDQQRLAPLLEEVRRQTGHCPADWQAMIAAGLIDQTPRDADGTAYTINTTTCRIEAQKKIRD